MFFRNRGPREPRFEQKRVQVNAWNAFFTFFWKIRSPRGTPKSIKNCKNGVPNLIFLEVGCRSWFLSIFRWKMVPKTNKNQVEILERRSWRRGVTSKSGSAENTVKYRSGSILFKNWKNEETTKSPEKVLKNRSNNYVKKRGASKTNFGRFLVDFGVILGGKIGKRRVPEQGRFLR